MAALVQAGTPPRGEDYIEEIGRLKTQFDVFRFMKGLTEAYRCRAFMVLNLPPITSFELQSNSVINNWPAELLSIYDQEGLLPTSPALMRLRNSTLPFVYEVVAGPDRDAGKSQLVVTLFERFRMTRFLYLPTHDASGLRGAVSLAGDRDLFSSEEIKDLSYIAIHVFDRLAEIRNLDVRVVDALTDREIDCLIWTAAGKTSAEIAEILSLSEHTVNHYLNRATKKLDTVNRTQAVAKALRVGLIK
ncbi:MULTISPECIES: LuxR family transcriptional regulator [unclassified Rhizobium]|uniref:helix-turn-helix transcriptional regulator n=1 Tax=unclassified Rhizobium TaxID=2613769 RepID=UPI00160FA214|nr:MULTISPECIES: LuxR family transcriptional regulator [unclassified Rhizobium]MBB3288595.1 DNA-binding CsgD family transcriptional regulator [Rhizobium sp. BK252]MBB3403268.1 DNA-binding CsgD family transcriptional regulator [Rhizobium sp. BK289]MBB3415843.1 DNA-binding CsgD family transcriptional regulator [Rhizobium sp. BK284]MBB3483731.1 DNA-binding CsgD family transcriptional regulator [Rhizobium sp. BK347]MDK4722290.1 LuxR family transcriptional regulator [Rhizobium sp. CNPSo 3968]